MLPKPGNTFSTPVSPTNDDAHRQRTKAERQSQACQQGDQVQCLDPDFHHNFINKIPKEEERQQNNILNQKCL